MKKQPSEFHITNDYIRSPQKSGGGLMQKRSFKIIAASILAVAGATTTSAYLFAKKDCWKWNRPNETVICKSSYWCIGGWNNPPPPVPCPSN
jgi:hypothetical protein